MKRRKDGRIEGLKERKIEPHPLVRFWKEGRKEERKDGRTAGRKEGRREGRKEGRKLATF